MKKIVAIVQARLSSKRLSNKVLMDLSGRTVVGQVFNQLSFSKLINDVVLATSLDKSDDPLENWANENNQKFYRGDLNNVLKRFYDTAKKFNADIIVRITADCPLIDPEVVDSVVKGYLEGDYDYFTNTNPPTFPDGLDTEVFSFSTLKKTYEEAKLQSEIEHVTPYIKNHNRKFRIGNYVSEINYEHYRWTLDNDEDYKFISEVYKRLHKKGPFIKWNDVINLLETDEKLVNINSHISRNLGFAKSLNEDKKIK